MDNLTSVNQAIWIATAIGCISGALISFQSITLDWLVNKQWMGWSITLRKVGFSISFLAALFGLGAFTVTAWQPASVIAQSPQTAIHNFFKIGLFISIATPISGQINNLISAWQETTNEPDSE